jgi:hypothetical protein
LNRMITNVFLTSSVITMNSIQLSKGNSVVNVIALSSEISRS